jgi:glucoamylase
VEEHVRDRSTSGGAWHWRADTPFDALPKGRELLIDMPVPFVLHLGFDDWQAVAERKSAPLPFGRHGVLLSTSDFPGHGALDFTLYYINEARWDGRNYRVRLPAA